MDKQSVAQGVADKLFATEEAFDMAMVRATQLLEAMVEARMALRISSSLSEVAQARTVEAISALSDAHRAIMATHAALDSLQDKAGIQTIAGDVIKQEGALNAVTTLRVAS